MSAFPPNIEQDKLDKALAELDNWYENAIKSGGGFKTEEERKAYVDSLGDLEKHPMFATSTEDLEGHPLAEAIRALKEEDKNRTELAIMYKDEGNDWLKKQDKDKAKMNKNLHEAYDRYTFAMKFLEQEVIELYYEQNPSIPPAFVVNENKESVKTLSRSLIYQQTHLLSAEQQQLLSQLYSNRGAANMLLQNYGQVKQDCTIALQIWKENLKAYQRKGKALFLLKQYKYCVDFTTLAIQWLQSKITRVVSEDTKEVSKIIEELQSYQQKAQEVLQQQYQRQRSLHDQTWQTLKQQWLNCFYMYRQLQLKLGYFSYAHPEPLQLKDVWPQYTGSLSLATTHQTMSTMIEELSQCAVPLLCLYPQYNQLDIIPDANLSCMLAEYLAMIFPEPEEGEEAASIIPWDIHREYHISNLVVYLSMHLTGVHLENPVDWLISCLEYHHLFQNGSIEFMKYALQELIQDPSYQDEIQSLQSSKQQQPLLLHQSDQKIYFQSSTIAELTSEMVHKIVKTREEALLDYQEKESKRLATSAKEVQYSSQFYYEVPLGCDLCSILQAMSRYQGLSRGVLSILVFPRSSKAHRVFLQKNQKENIPILVLK